jgi:hypothetical protein
LLALKDKLETEFGFAVLGLAFDGDSCFNVLHEEFIRQWKSDLPKDIQFLRSVISTFVIICDPLHLLKRIRFLVLLQFICPEEHFEFFLSIIPEVHILSPVVFSNSRESKMHDSLPLELLSLKTLAYILNNPIVCETMMVL